MLNRTHYIANYYSPVSIPASECLGASTGKIALEADDHGLAGVRKSIKLVLLSNDDEFCRLVRSYLQHLGFCVLTCTSSDRARQFLEKNDIDLWLIDVEALGIEAMYFATMVRDLRSEVPILVVSGMRQENSPFLRLFEQSWPRIRKPIQLPDLLATVHRVLGNERKPSTTKRQDDKSNAFESNWMSEFSGRGNRKHLLN